MVETIYWMLLAITLKDLKKLDGESFLICDNEVGEFTVKKILMKILRSTKLSSTLVGGTRNKDKGAKQLIFPKK
jgi:hypothetical protein